MNFTNILFNLMSLTNLTIFLDRLINDGPYQSAILLYDYGAIGDTNFIQELTDSTNRNYTIVTVCLDNTSPQILESISYRNILNALHIVIFTRGFRVPNVIFSRDNVFTLPVRSYGYKQRTLWELYSSNAWRKGNMSVIFYETPLTIGNKRGVYNQIEAYVVNYRKTQPNRTRFAIDSRRDIHSQLKQMGNLAADVFEPARKTLLHFPHFDGVRNQKHIGTTKNVLSDSVNVYMANYITRNMKNVFTWQTFERPNFIQASNIAVIITSVEWNEPAANRLSQFLSGVSGVGVLIHPMEALDSEVPIFQLYPHDVEDYVFVIYQSGAMVHSKGEMKSTATPILQWFIIIILCSLVLHVLRRMTGGQNTLVNYLVAFIDSVAIFLGNALNKISNNRPERCFIIGFSVFGLIFKTIFTGNLFVMYQQHSDSRIRTVDQLFQLDIQMYYDVNAFICERYELCKFKPPRCHPARPNFLYTHLFRENQLFAILTSKSAAERFLFEAKDSIPQNTSAGHDLYILDETYVRLYKRFQLWPRAPEADEMNVLIQRCVESGIFQFYKRMESFLAQLKNPLYGTEPDDQSVYITMDHIWIYVYGFLIANGLCVAVFIGEILYFHREKILSCLRRGMVASMRGMRKIKNELLHNRVWRFFGRVGVASLKLVQRLKNRSRHCYMWRYVAHGVFNTRGMIQRFGNHLFHAEIWRPLRRPITPMQKMMQKMKNELLTMSSKMWKFFGRGTAATMRLIQRMTNRRTRVHPFSESN